jgi:hypothetical protein
MNVAAHLSCFTNAQFFLKQEASTWQKNGTFARVSSGRNS